MKSVKIHIHLMIFISLLQPQYFDNGRWNQPIEGGFHLLAPYSLPHGKYQKGHRGLDIGARLNEVVHAPASGQVTFSGTVVDRPLLTIQTGENEFLSMEPIKTDLTAGDFVASGDTVGSVAEGGHCSAQCIHVGVRVNGEYVNPLKWFRKQPTLLP